MIHKLRRKFVIAIMTIVMAFLLAILGGLYISARNGFERMALTSMRQMDMRTTPARSNPDAQGVPRLPKKAVRRDAPSPVASVSIAASGTVKLMDNQIYEIADEDFDALSARVLAQEKESGVLQDMQLRYVLFRHGDGTQQIIFASTQFEQEILTNQLLFSLLIALAAFFLFLGVSVLLARWMTKPVEEAFNRQRQFVADASHELKTPLTVILSNTDMLMASGQIVDDKNLRRLDNIRADSRRMKGLVEDLLSLARADAKKEVAAFEPLSMSHLTSCALAGIEPTLFDSGRTLREDITPDLFVCGDAVRLRQLVDILLDNACKYSIPGGEIRVTLSAQTPKALCLHVVSQGNPIPAEEYDLLFHRFYRRDASRGEAPGYGLGLPIARSIVQAHDGRIGVQSEQDKNIFFVHLPRCTAPT